MKEKRCKLVFLMGCLRLTYDDYLPTLKVAKALFLSEEKTDAGSYLYGFNGMEKDDEMYASNGNSYTTEFRQYSPRLGRWLSMDPVMHHQLNPYNGFDNNPIYFKDPKGSNSEGGPGDRAINKDIGDGTGDAAKAGTTEEIANGTVVYADVSLNNAGEKNNKAYSNAYQIAIANNIKLDDLYAMNPGLFENNREIGQGQKIFIAKTNVGVSGPEGERITIDNAPIKSFWSFDISSIFKDDNNMSDEKEKEFNDFREKQGGGASQGHATDNPADSYEDVRENEKKMWEAGESGGGLYWEYSTQGYQGCPICPNPLTGQRLYQAAANAGFSGSDTLPNWSYDHNKKMKVDSLFYVNGDTIRVQAGFIDSNGVGSTPRVSARNWKPLK